MNWLLIRAESNFRAAKRRPFAAPTIRCLNCVNPVNARLRKQAIRCASERPSLGKRGLVMARVPESRQDERWRQPPWRRPGGQI